MLLSVSACAKQKDDFENYKNELIEKLKNELGGATPKETLIIWQAQEEVRGSTYESSKSMDENKKALDLIVEKATQELAWECATIEDHAENGLFRKDYAVSLVTEADGDGYTSATQLVFDWLVSDAAIKNN